MQSTLDELRRARAVALLEAEERAIRRTARRFSLCPDDAEDAFQRAVLILLTRAPEPNRPEGLIGWMHVVTRNEALAVRRQRTRLLAGGDPDARAEEASEAPGPAAVLEQRERADEVRSRLRRLKPAERRAIALQAAGCSYAEIQAITGWTYTKVNRSLAEGRAELRAMPALA